MKQSEKLKKEYSALNYWWHGLYHSLWTQPHARITDENKDLRRQAEAKLFEIQKLIEQIYGKQIGSAVMLEIRNDE